MLQTRRLFGVQDFKYSPDSEYSGRADSEDFSDSESFWGAYALTFPTPILSKVQTSNTFRTPSLSASESR